MNKFAPLVVFRTRIEIDWSEIVNNDYGLNLWILSPSVNNSIREDGNSFLPLSSKVFWNKPNDWRANVLEKLWKEFFVRFSSFDKKN